MFPPNDENQLSAHTNSLSIQNSPTMMQVDQKETIAVVKQEMQMGWFSQAESVVYRSKKLQDELLMMGTKIRQHEDNIKHLMTQENQLDESILEMQVLLGKYHSSSTPKIENEDSSSLLSEEEVTQRILEHEKSAAGILCQLKTHHVYQAANLTLTKDLLGIVATLGKIDDGNLSRLLSEYLGAETMLAIVCKTCEGAKALELYEKEGCISKSSGLHGLGASMGRTLNGRFLVICIENLRPYAGEFVPADPQRKLALMKPRLSNGECPPGFLGFAVNMINLDKKNLSCLTASGNGLRETLFYNLFARLQVYKTRADMIQALPCITDGAVSLDGGIVKTTGMFSLGDREEIGVIFPKFVSSSLPESYTETEKQIKELKWKKEKIVEDGKRERALMDKENFNFLRKKDEFLKFQAEMSSHASQLPQTPSAHNLVSPR